MLREYQSEIEKLKQMIEKGGFEGGEVVPSEVLFSNKQADKVRSITKRKKTVERLQLKNCRSSWRQNENA